MRVSRCVRASYKARSLGTRRGSEPHGFNTLRPMRRLDTRLDGTVLLEPDVHGDARGFFLESYRANVWAEHGIGGEFVQDNHSRSGRGVLRGMHFSIGDGQAKLVRCARGRSSTSSSTCGARRRPMASGRRTSSTTSTRASSSSPSASPTASACCPTSPT